MANSKRFPKHEMEMRERSSGWTLVLGYALSQVPAVRESKGTAWFASLLPKPAVLSSWLNWGFPPYQPSPWGCASGHRARAPAKGTESRCKLGHGFVRLDLNLCCMCPSPGPTHKPVVTSNFVSAPGNTLLYGRPGGGRTCSTQLCRGSSLGIPCSQNSMLILHQHR